MTKSLSRVMGVMGVVGAAIWIPSCKTNAPSGAELHDVHDSMQGASHAIGIIATSSRREETACYFRCGIKEGVLTAADCQPILTFSISSEAVRRLKGPYSAEFAEAADDLIARIKDPSANYELRRRLRTRSFEYPEVYVINAFIKTSQRNDQAYAASICDARDFSLEKTLVPWIYQQVSRYDCASFNENLVFPLTSQNGRVEQVAADRICMVESWRWSGKSQTDKLYLFRRGKVETVLKAHSVRQSQHLAWVVDEGPYAGSRLVGTLDSYTGDLESIGGHRVIDLDPSRQF